MRVFQINSVCGIRSTGRICTDLADIIKENDGECEIAYGREQVPEKYQGIAYRIGSNIDVRGHALASRIFDSAGFGSKKATRHLIEHIREYKPDIIHLHNVHGYYINIEILFTYLAEADIPVVWTLHDCWAFTGHCSYFSMEGCERWKKGCGCCPQKKKYPTSYFMDASRKNWERKKALFTGVKHMTIVTPSQWLADLVKESFLGKYEVKVIPNGIDLSVFKPTESSFRAEYGLEDKKIVLGVASTWDKRKGFDDFLKLAEKVDNRTCIVLVGIDKKQKGVPEKNMIGIGCINDSKKMAEIYTSADILFNPTYEDNYPTVNLEAQACGTPVITYETGGSSESVDQDSVVSKGDTDAAFDKIRESHNLKIVPPASREKQYGCYLKLYKMIRDKRKFD